MSDLPICPATWPGNDSPGSHAEHHCRRYDGGHRRHECLCGAEMIEDPS